ncbi:hypothetical protein Lser_V15G39240 [Lactuca serriola]
MGRKVRTKWPDENNFYEAVITDYNPVEKPSLLQLVFDKYDHASKALMYLVLVACKSISNLRKAAAQEVVEKVRQHSGLLVDQVK